MERKIVVATQNKGKMAEFKRILEPFGFVVLSMKDAGHDLDIVEDGETFADNARIKAEALWKVAGCYTLADDSGLCVDALGGAPGVHSARYMGEATSYEIKMRGLLSALSTVSEEKRTAQFVSVIAFTNPEGDTVLFDGFCEGRIGYEPKGDRGFGYDPIFMVGNRSYAQLEDHEKDALSHRGRALEKFCAYLSSQP